MSPADSRSATGIPDRTRFGDLSRIRAGDLLTWLVQEHDAQRAGKHYDLRLGGPELGLYSWATRKGIPRPGERPRGVYRQPLHEFGYKDFEGTLRGYGAGVVRKAEEGSVLVTKVTPTAIHFVRADRKEPERFVLLKPKNARKETDWLLLNVTPRQPLPYAKLHFTRLPAEEVESALRNMQEGTSVQTKIDGASSLVRLLKRGVEVTSYRVSANNRPIVHTERLFAGPGPEINLPRHLVNSVLRGELYGVRREDNQEKAIPPQELGGLLNSTLGRSIAEQRRKGVTLRNALFDLQQLGTRPIDFAKVPYARRRRMLEEIVRYLPADRFHLMEQATTPEEALALWERIRKGEHPLTQEGIVIHPPTGKPAKAKLLEEQDVYITGFFPGEGRLHGRGVGGFTYALSPEGPTVGRVGTGLSDELRRDMYSRPQDYLGRVARVRYQGQFPHSGALRAPSLIALHEDYPDMPTSALLQKQAFSATLAKVAATATVKHARQGLQKQAIEAQTGGLPSRLLSTLAVLNPATWPDILVSPKMLSVTTNPRKLKDVAEELLAESPQTQELLKDTLIRQGGSDIIDDLIWKKERGEPLPFYKQIGGRLWHNPHTSLLGKLVSTATYLPNMLYRNLFRSSHYFPSLDVVQIYGNTPGQLANLLGRAAAQKSVHRYLSDLLAFADIPTVPISALPETLAAIRAAQMVRGSDLAKKNPELYAEIMPQLFAENARRIATPIGSMFGLPPMVGAIFGGTSAGRLMGKSLAEETLRRLKKEKEQAKTNSQ